jgi:hypothetical protein
MSAAYVIRCTVGRIALPAFPEGRFLGWQAGYLAPLCRQECATRYPSIDVAESVARRAEEAYSGTSFEVERLKP